MDGPVRRFGSKEEAVKRGNVEAQQRAGVRELAENPEKYKGRLGFDFIFDKTGKPYCVELNGNLAGVMGLADIKKGRKVSPLAKMMAMAMTRAPREQNPGWLESIASNKALHAHYIPDENRPESVSGGSFEHLLDRGPVMVKPRFGGRGQGITFLDKKGWQDTREQAADNGIELKPTVEDFHKGAVYQQFVEPADAECASPDLKGHPASLRVLIDYSVLPDGSVRFDAVAGYQRVSRYKPEDIGKEIERDGKTMRVTAADVYIVNKAREAYAIDWSETEQKAVLPIAKKIIENIDEGNKSRVLYMSDAADRSESARVQAAQHEVSLYFNMASYLQERYGVQVALLYRNKQNFPTLEFLEKLDRELKNVDKDALLELGKKKPFVWQKYQYPDRLEGEVQLRSWRGKSKVDFSLKNNGELRKLLEGFRG